MSDGVTDTPLGRVRHCAICDQLPAANPEDDDCNWPSRTLCVGHRDLYLHIFGEAGMDNNRELRRLEVFAVVLRKLPLYALHGGVTEIRPSEEVKPMTRKPWGWQLSTTPEELLKYELPTNYWHLAPNEAREFAEVGGCIVHHPVEGWFVLTKGENPGIIWAQN